MYVYDAIEAVPCTRARLRSSTRRWKSCGFDAFELKDREDAEAALSAFGNFSEAYQASVARPLPLFRRRVPRAASQSK